jgi:hypothetical protein
VSDEHLSLARQDSYEFDNLSNEPSATGLVYEDKELVRLAQNDDPWAIEQLILRYQKLRQTSLFDLGYKKHYGSTCD